MIDPELSEIYGRLMDDRNISDYQLIGRASREKAARDLQQASTFVESIQAV